MKTDSLKFKKWFKNVVILKKTFDMVFLTSVDLSNDKEQHLI